MKKLQEMLKRQVVCRGASPPTAGAGAPAAGARTFAVGPSWAHWAASGLPLPLGAQLLHSHYGLPNGRKTHTRAFSGGWVKMSFRVLQYPNPYYLLPVG